MFIGNFEAGVDPKIAGMRFVEDPKSKNEVKEGELHNPENLCIYKVTADSSTVTIYNTAWANNFYIALRDNGLSDALFETNFYSGRATILKKDGTSFTLNEITSIVNDILTPGILISAQLAGEVLDVARKSQLEK